jgi:RNA polymerase primary sigma factor
MVIANNSERADAIRIYLREIGQTPLLTPAEEVTLAARVKRGDKKARLAMIKANLRLVVKIAHDYDGLGLPLLDLINEGNIGLMKAVERFNPKKGAKLSTYAALWIKQAIRRALSNQSKTIRLPVHVVGKLYQLQRAGFKLAEELGHEPTDDELADKLKIPRDKLIQLRAAAARPASLDAPVGDEGETRFGDLVEDSTAMSPYELLRMKTMRQDVRQQLKHLTDREAEILTLRFGLDGHDHRTLDEVGKRFKVSRERIRQIQDLALAKLRRRMEGRDKAEIVLQS